MVAAFGLGAGWSALDRAIPYSTKRIQGGSAAVGEAGLHPQADRAQRGAPGSRPRLYRRNGASASTPDEGSLNTEGAIAKYMSTEAGNAAADASIQALGGYGYTHEYMVEKISRDVRITTIYEGTSEIMEMTISRDRWQLHLKTRGQHYHEQARRVRGAARSASECRRRCSSPGAARPGRSYGESARGTAHALSAHSVAHWRVDRIRRMRRDSLPGAPRCRPKAS